MYHCAYSCPCHTYRNPVDFAPDRGSGRNVAKRSIGARFITRKRSRLEEEEEEMADSEDVEDLIKSDEEEEEKDGCSKLVEPMDSDYEPDEDEDSEERRRKMLLQRRRSSESAESSKKMATSSSKTGLTASAIRELV